MSSRVLARPGCPVACTSWWSLNIRSHRVSLSGIHIRLSCISNLLFSLQSPSAIFPSGGPVRLYPPHQEKKSSSRCTGSVRTHQALGTLWTHPDGVHTAPNAKQTGNVNSDAARHSTVGPDADRHGICLPDVPCQGIFLLDALCQGIFLLDARCQGIFLLDVPC